MKQIMLLSFVLLTIRIFGQDTTIIIQDGFETGNGNFLPHWTPASTTSNGLVQVVKNVGGITQAAHTGEYAAALGKSADTGGSNTNRLDLAVPLGQFDGKVVELSFRVFDYYEINNPEDGILLDNVCVNGCSTTAAFSPGLSESVIVFPNPASDMLQIGMAQEVASVRASIATADGRVLYQAAYRPAGGAFSVPVRHLPDGIYSVRLEYGNGVVAKRFVKQ